ncbi:peptidoglycan recognition protein family protein [Streptosporangium sp. CA-135522]|uniref:peptidoglycan recognition protein family protein n=1 Tax=Streptosporangium sp. CA-135522 TaxID=3240072 RepID=UPI003D8DA168
MSRMLSATWKPISGNFTPDGQVEVRGVVLHIMAGTLSGTDSWFRNPRAQASSHFGTGKQGALYQWVDTRDRAWTQGQGNRSWVSIENEGKGGDELTDAQLDRCAQVLAWAHHEHGVPLQVAIDPDGRGLGHHSMGGRAWGGHLQCPGARIIAQKPEIVRRARLLVIGRPQPKPAPTKNWTETLLEALPLLRLGCEKDPALRRHIKTAHRLLDARGFPIPAGVDDQTFGAPMRDRVMTLQKAKGLDDVDGIIGPDTWVALH